MIPKAATIAAVVGLAVFLGSRRKDEQQNTTTPKKPESPKAPNQLSTSKLRVELPISGEIRDRLGAPRSHGPHQGIDIYAPNGSAVKAWGNGIVKRVIDGRKSTKDSTKRAGLWIDVTGDDGNVHRYLHLGSVFVKSNMRITRGQPIGTIEGDHLHFEVRQGHNGYGTALDVLPA